MSCITAGLWAQNTQTDPDNANSLSPINVTTSGRYKTAIDDYISPQDYTSLKLNNWFSYVSYATAGQPQLGFAKQIKNVYLAFYYKGMFWGGLNNFTGKEETVVSFMGGDDKNLTTYTMPSPLDNPDNSAAVLIGFANMGIRLGFSSTFDHFESGGDMRVESGPSQYRYYKSYSLENGNLIPQIKWGMAKDLIPQGIRPYLTATLNFHRENAKADEYLAADKTSGEQILYAQNSLQPSFAAGLGGFTFYNGNGFKGAVDLDYTIRFITYNNDYSYVQDTSAGIASDYIYKTKTINGTWGPASAANPTPILRERSNLFNSIVPSANVSWSSGKIGLKAKLRTNFDIENTRTIDLEVRRDVDTGVSNGELYQCGDDITKNDFTFTPRLDLAMQYSIIPDRLLLNVGGRISRGITTTTTNTKVYDIEGKEDRKKASTTTNTSYGTMLYRLYAGTMFNFTENVWMEAATGIQNGVNVFGTGNDGLFNFTSLAIGLKF